MSNQDIINQEIRLNPSLSSLKKKKKKKLLLFIDEWETNVHRETRFFHMGEENSSRTGKMFLSPHPSFACMSLTSTVSNVCLQ